MNSTPIRLGVVGVGGHCTHVLLPLLPMLPVQLVAVADPDPARRDHAAEHYGATGRYADAAAMYAAERLDAVLICVGPRHHPALVAQALDAGLHVWVEKPLATSALEIAELIPKRRDRVVVVGFKKAFMPGIRRLRELATRPDAGRMLNLMGEYPVNLPPGGSAALASGLAGGWLANGCHPLAAMLAIGGPVARLTSHLNQSGHGVIALEFANGAMGSLNLLPLRGVNDRYAVFTERCHAEVENGWTIRWHRGGALVDGWDFTSSGDHGGTVVWEPNNAFARNDARLEATQGFWHELEHFCTCIRTGRPASVGTLEFALDLQHAWDAALASDGRRIAVGGLPATAIAVTRAGAVEAHVFPWGGLTWFANGAQGNDQGLTVGRCLLKPGQGNPPHRHRGHGEVLVVQQGRIRHTGPGDGDIELGPGDVVSIPPGVPHQAHNIGDEDAILAVAYPVPVRDVVGE
jgi:predicted dehydrogenase/quercetin dioxygenase-like cupin family protein